MQSSIIQRNNIIKRNITKYNKKTENNRHNVCEQRNLLCYFSVCLLVFLSFSMYTNILFPQAHHIFLHSGTLQQIPTQKLRVMLCKPPPKGTNYRPGWWHTPAIPALRKLKQKHHKPVQGHEGYIVRLYLKGREGVLTVKSAAQSREGCCLQSKN